MKKIDEMEPELLDRVARGDAEAFTLFYESRHPRVKWFASAISKGYPYDLDDLSQEVFLSVWERRVMMPGVASVDGYLFITVRNILALSRRQSKIRDKVYRRYQTRQEAWYNDSESEVMQKFLKNTASEAIASLPEKRKEVFRLNVYCGMPQKEIAEHLSISTQRVGQHLAQAKTDIRTYLEKNADWIAVVSAGILLIISLLK